MFDTIESAISDLKDGKMVIVVDDESRENEGDFIMPAQNITAADVNFIATHGRGLICAPMTKQIAQALELPIMVERSEDNLKTAFTISVDAKFDISTGISAMDRAKTLNLLAASKTKASELSRPGHIFPLIAREGGVSTRQGHTEAGVDLAVMAGFSPVAVICEILSADGSAARVPELRKLADKFDLKFITIEDLVNYKIEHQVPKEMYEKHRREFSLS